MKIQKISFDQLKQYKHPSAVLFRYIELRETYNLVKDIDFKQPSLDLGSGDGYLSSLMFDKKFTIGLDNGEANDVQISIEKKRYKKVLIEGAEKMSLPDKSMNFVFSNSVLEHIPDIDSVLSEVSRVLKKGGKFLFTSPSNNFSNFLYLSFLLNEFGLGFMANWYIKQRNKMLNHYHLYSTKKWQKKLNKYGLKIEKSSYCISQETLKLWDKMALEVFFQRQFDKNAEAKLYKKYKNAVLKMIDDPSNYNLTKGADQVICAVKK